jgi:hypothetical protein
VVMSFPSIKGLDSGAHAGVTIERGGFLFRSRRYRGDRGD